MKQEKYVKALFYMLLLFFIVALFSKEYFFRSEYNPLQIPPHISLQNGDVILRKESNRISDIFAQINASRYSHIGTIIVNNNKIKVVHIEENEEANDFKKVAIEKFIFSASEYALYRPLHKTDTNKLLTNIKEIELKNPKFDIEFRGDENDNKIYCTELAYTLYINSTDSNLQAKKNSYLTIDFIPITLFSNKQYFKQIYKSK